MVATFVLFIPTKIVAALNQCQFIILLFNLFICVVNVITDTCMADIKHVESFLEIDLIIIFFSCHIY